jgi:hypothetical protein
MQMKTTAGPKRKYNSPSHPGIPPFEVIEIAAAAVSCAASGGLSLGSGGWTSSCATDARLGEVRDGEASPAGVDRTKCDESESKRRTLERRLLFSDGIETITRSSSSIVRKSLLSLSSGKKNLLSTYSKILFRFNFLRLPYDKQQQPDIPACHVRVRVL